MESGLDLAPVPREKRRASTFDVMLLFAGANIVTTTLVTGGSLAPAFSFRQAVGLIVLGSLLGTGLIALLARLGPRHGLPTMVLLRWPFGRLGAAGISWILILTNFAWIALNNVIAASAMTQLMGGPAWMWNVAVAMVAVAVAMVGPRAMALFDRVAVPLLLLVGVGMTWSLFGQRGQEALAQVGDGSMGLLAGFDLVVGYQISWCLMFADYTRYQRREGSASRAAFLGLAISSAWLMVLGAGAGLAGGGNDPTAMVLSMGLPAAALLLMALSTVTTNFVNLYLSSLAIKNLRPSMPDRPTVLLVGIIGTGFGLASPQLLDRYAGFMGWIGTTLLPIVAVAVVHFFWSGSRAEETESEPAVWRPAAIMAWAAGVGTYQALAHFSWQLGATLPTLLVTGLVYALLRRS